MKDAQYILGDGSCIGYYEVCIGQKEYISYSEFYTIYDDPWGATIKDQYELRSILEGWVKNSDLVTKVNGSDVQIFKKASGLAGYGALWFEEDDDTQEFQPIEIENNTDRDIVKNNIYIPAGYYDIVITGGGRRRSKRWVFAYCWRWSDLLHLQERYI